MLRRGEQPWRTTRARALRENQTSAEAKLWQRLRNRQLCGLKFVRRLPIADYFADFACREAQVVVEIDGVTHATVSETLSDTARELALRQEGYRVFRVSNTDVYDNIVGVLEALAAFAAAAPHLNPLPQRVKSTLGERE